MRAFDPVYIGVGRRTSGAEFSAPSECGPGRSELFGNSADGYFKVHDQGPTEAEGSGGTWERRRLGPHLYVHAAVEPPRTDDRSRSWERRKGRLAKEFGKTVKAIEARNGVRTPA